MLFPEFTHLNVMNVPPACVPHPEAARKVTYFHGHYLGRRLGQLETVACLWRKKFGQIAPAAISKLVNMNADELLSVACKILDAESPDAIVL